MEQVVSRFDRYVKIWTESDSKGAAVNPSTPRQFDLAKLLVEEMKALGIENARCDEYCYVYGSVPATPGCEHLPAIGLIAHLDTSPDLTGRDVKPQVIRYEGGDIVLNEEKGIVMKRDVFPFLARYEGQELMCTDGTTLLGADDKAGIAIIMQGMEELLAAGTPHGKICIGFTPDEELGRGTDNFDVEGFGADFAFTVDGGAISDYAYETFNAAAAKVTVNGVSIHPGASKDKMKNALLIGMEFNSLLPAMEVPARTEGYEGFFHLTEMSGRVETARMSYIVRDHDMGRFLDKKAVMEKAAEEINKKYGAGTLVLELRDQYYNMYEILKDRMEIVELAEEAMKAAGIEKPSHYPVRGGTDGCMLTYKGLPCPNLPTGGHNFHGKYEFIPLESLRIGVKIVKNILSPALLEGKDWGKK